MGARQMTTSVAEAQKAYVEWSTRHHWARKKLQAKRAEKWRTTTNHPFAYMTRLEEEERELEWCNAEAEHWMVYWRAVLHAQGVQAI